MKAARGLMGEDNRQARADRRGDERVATSWRERDPERDARTCDAALLGRLKRSEARYKALVETSSNLVWVRDRQLHFTEACPDWERFTGMRFDQYRGEGWIDAIHPGDRAEMRRVMQRSRETGEPMVRTRYRLWRCAPGGGGEYRHCEATVTPVRDESGEIVEWVGMVQDRTEQHMLEAHRDRQTQELARSNKDLEDFAYVAAHDLKEPLRGIRLTANFLEEDARDKLDDDARKRLTQLQDLCARMQVLLDSLLESARLAATPLEMEECELSGVLGEALQLAGARLHEAGVEVGVDPSAQGVRVCCDRQRMAQVFANLVVNAVKYNGSPTKRVELGVLPSPDGSTAVFVRDNGIGIPPDKLEQVFRMFRRLHPRECYGGGAGAGLAIVKKIVERHGGRVWLESKGDKQGTTAFISLPAAVECGATQAPF